MEMTMGKLVVTAKVENLDDLVLSKKGTLSADAVRAVEVAIRSMAAST